MMKVRTRSILAALVAVGMLSISTPATAANSGAEADTPGLTQAEQETLLAIFGYEPSEAEQTAYLEHYGSVPTEAQIAAYLASSDEDEPVANIVSDPAANAVGARAATFYTYFDSGRWITRNGVVSLSLMPRSGGISAYDRDPAWTMVLNNFSSSPNWRNGAVMRQQFDCHAWYGMLKTPWNLEPHRTSMDPFTCN